jgi:hypothetical protein
MRRGWILPHPKSIVRASNFHKEAGFGIYSLDIGFEVIVQVLLLLLEKSVHLKIGVL